MTCLETNFLDVADPLFGKQYHCVCHHLLSWLPWKKRPPSMNTDNTIIKLVHYMTMTIIKIQYEI